MSKHGVFTTLLHYRANTVLPRDLPRWRAADSRPYERNRRERSAKYAPSAMRYICVGADIIRPVVSPLGKQRRRIAPTMAQSNICKRSSAISCQNMEYLQHCYISWPIWFCPKICDVGGRMISAPTRSVPPNHRAEISMRCAAMYRVSTLYRQIPSANVRYSNCRRFAPTLFPQWGNNRAADSR